MRVEIIMGSASDYEVMSGAAQTLASFGVAFEEKVLSAHRTPDLLTEYVRGARSRGTDVIIAGAGGAAHLAGVVAANTTLPVIGVPILTKGFGGMDSLLSTVQMPSGVPVATVAVNGAKNAALLAVEILALGSPALTEALDAFRREQTEKIRNTTLPPAK